MTRARADPVSSSPWICAMWGRLSAASVCASRVKRASRSGSAANASGRTLIATSIQPRVARPIDLAHATSADWGEDLVRAEAGAGGRQGAAII